MKRDGVAHDWQKVRARELRKLGFHWQCRHCGTYRQIRSRTAACPQLTLPPPVLRPQLDGTEAMT